MKPASAGKFIFFLLFAFACSQTKIDTEKASQIYVDLLILEESGTTGKDSLARFKEEVFSNYGVSKSDFEEYMKSLVDNREETELFFKSARRYLEDRKKTNSLN